jgi:hypothetical protein
MHDRAEAPQSRPYTTVVLTRFRAVYRATIWLGIGATAAMQTMRESVRRPVAWLRCLMIS